MKHQPLLLNALTLLAGLSSPADVLELKGGKMLNGKLLIIPTVGSICLCLVLLGAGCGSLGGPASGSFAAVTIQNRSLTEIVGATTKVFYADGYSGGLQSSGKLVFQKEASRATTWSQEGFLALQSGAQTVNRVRVEIRSMGDGSAYRLQCQAYVVRDAGALLEDEVRLTNLRGAPYQSLLNKVKKQLN